MAPNVVDQLYLELRRIWQRRWIALAVAWFVAVVGAAGVVMLPDEYESEARIYVDTDSLLGPLLQGITVQDDIGSRVDIMQRTLLSKPNVTDVIRTVDLDLTVHSREEMEALIENITRRTSVKAQTRELFTVSHVADDPELAKDIVESLLTIFIESNVGRHRSDVQSAKSFLNNQIETYERQLRETEKKLADFKSKHTDVLGTKNFTSRLGDARDELEQASIEYEDALIRLEKLQQRLAETPQYVAADTAPQSSGGSQSVSPTLERISALEQRLDDLLLRYTEQHPDVITTRRQLKDLREQYEGERRAAAENGGANDGSAPVRGPKVQNPVYEELQLRLVEAESEVATKERRVENAQQNLERLRQMANTAPKLEAQLADLNRDYKVLQEKYQDLLSRRESARISEAREIQTKSVEFRIVDPPEAPARPSGPNRPLYLGVVLVFALGAGGGFAYLLAQLDESFPSPERLRETFAVPVIGTIARATTAAGDWKRRATNLSFGTAFSALVAVFVVLIVFMPQVEAVRDSAAVSQIVDKVKEFSGYD